MDKDGLKLSPPNLELEDGIYVLLRASSDGTIATIPSEFEDSLLDDNDLAEIKACPWSLSGPQYPKRAGSRIQQRYCYPRGLGSYSTGKGGAMWTLIDRKGKENIDQRVLHVYHSSKRAGHSKKAASNKSKANTTAVATRQSKRKASLDIDNNATKKKSRVVSSVGSFPPQCPSLMQGELLKSPCQTQMSFDDQLVSNLDLTSNNLFDTTSSFPQNNNQIYNNFSFMPSDETSDRMMLMNNPGFNSAAGMNGGYYFGQYAFPPHAWAAAARSVPPSIPELTSSFDWQHQQQHQQQQGKASILSVDNFSKRLKDMEVSLTNDIEGSTSTDQVLKLHLLQNWAKGIAQRPLQPQQPELETKAGVVADEPKAVVNEEEVEMEASSDTMMSDTESKATGGSKQTEQDNKNNQTATTQMIVQEQTGTPQISPENGAAGALALSMI